MVKEDKVLKSVKSLEESSSFWQWLTHYQVIGIILGVIIGDALSRLLMNFNENLIRPALNGFVDEDPLDPSYCKFGAIKILPRSFLVALLEFFIVLVIAYFLLRKFRVFQNKP